MAYISVIDREKPLTGASPEKENDDKDRYRYADKPEQQKRDSSGQAFAVFELRD